MLKTKTHLISHGFLTIYYENVLYLHHVDAIVLQELKQKMQFLLYN